MPTSALPAAAAGRPATRGLGVSRSIVALPYDRIVNGMLFAGVASSCLAFIEPSPYDVLLLGVMGLWFLGGFTLHRTVVPVAALLLLYTLGGFLALLPYLGEPDPTTFMVQSLYLTLSAIFFACFFAQNTAARTDTCLKAYALGTVVAGACGIAGYFNIGGTGALFSLYDRASGTFKDPNVLGSYLIAGALYLMQTLVLGRTRHGLASFAALLVVLAAIFLSFSRGAWGATLAAAMLTVGFAYATSGSRRVRRRIVTMGALAVVAGVIALLVLLSIGSVRDLFLQRFALTQDYDTGETGRFGNQLRAIPMLMERLNGFGPVRFRLIFDLDSHNSYIGSFASYGWLGGGCFFLLVGLTTFVGFRLMLRRSPVQRLAQVAFPALFVVLAQGFQIDIDHWRHSYLLLGMVWGLEIARVKWAEQVAQTGPVPSVASPALA